MKKYQLLIDNDLEVRIDHIDQWFTYSGLLEGLPTNRLNTMILERTKEEAKERFHSDAVYLIEPTQTPIEYEGRYVFGKPMQLPSITCVCSVASSEVFRNKEMHGSHLIIIWLQEDYAFPIEETIIEKIKEIPFRKICKEFEY
ncbi:hypothetical protein C8N46_101171 [Kordia periserrulae]|uniref:Uncharacterized protein n=1 Tax=Kordia periserrulae TaxID=701523 RepID=A0A2T6C5H6_9FLAO|nr:hypothetical protein [Kordia periserrulae]PTX63570.1 hypothetical protein C8N46_101171 [Kordia periserrulae]